MEEKKRGRPAGSKTRPAEVVEAIPAACPKCGCTERSVMRVAKETQCTGYGADGDGYQEVEHGGVTADGRHYTHTVWRRVMCHGCQSPWVELRRENRAGITPAA
jgi:hypothetical protein